MIFVAAVGAHQVDPAFKHRLAGGGHENMSVLSLEITRVQQSGPGLGSLRGPVPRHVVRSSKRSWWPARMPALPELPGLPVASRCRRAAMAPKADREAVA